MLNTFQPEIVIFLNTLSLRPKKVCVYKKENVYKNVEAQITLKFMEVVPSDGVDRDTGVNRDIGLKMSLKPKK